MFKFLVGLTCVIALYAYVWGQLTEPPEDGWYITQSPKTGLCYEISYTPFNFGGVAGMAVVDQDHCDRKENPYEAP